MKAYVDQDTCIGCEACVGICPQVFSMNDEGKSEAITTELNDMILDDAKTAECECPVDAITVQ